MALIGIPENPIRWRSATWGLNRADARIAFVSGASQVTAYPAALWAGQIELPPLHDDQGKLRRWRAALASLSSFENWFEARPPGAENGPSTGYTGPTPVVALAGQLGNALLIDGATASVALLNAGDYFSVIANGWRELKMATADAITNSAGQATLKFEPALRNAPAQSAEVEVAAPTTSFQLADPTAVWRLGLGGFGEIALDVVEYFAPGAGTAGQQPSSTTFDSTQTTFDQTDITWDAA